MLINKSMAEIFDSMAWWWRNLGSKRDNFCGGRGQNVSVLRTVFMYWYSIIRVFKLKYSVIFVWYGNRKHTITILTYQQPVDGFCKPAQRRPPCHIYAPQYRPRLSYSNADNSDLCLLWILTCRQPGVSCEDR